jgi:hypothetical protein
MSSNAPTVGRAGRFAVLSAAVSVVLLAGCGSQNQGPSTVPSASPSPIVSLLPSPSPQDLKPVLGGLLDRSGAPPPAYLGSLAGYVVNVNWSDLQPSSGDTIAPDNAIDQAITAVREANSTEHAHLGLKIRIFAGVNAPEWAKKLGGNPVDVSNPQNGSTGTIGRFWTDAYGVAYDRLERLLAAKYDQVSVVREVTISRCTTFYDEPFIRDISDSETVSALLAAGYTIQADENCQMEEIQAAAVWQHTHSDLAFNPYQEIGPDGSTATDEPFTASMMIYCRQTLGTACVLENNSLRTPPQPEYMAMYSEMLTLGQPLAFQTATAERIGDLDATLQYAVLLGANSVELPGGYQSLATPASFAATNGALAAQPGIAPSPAI